MTMLIEDNTLSLIFDTNTLQRGKRYFSQSRVQDLELSIEGMSLQVLRANVAGSQSQTYRTEVRFDRYMPYKVATFCSCPVSFCCKHAVAVILQANYDQSLAGETNTPNSPAVVSEHAAETWLARITSVKASAPKPESAECLVYLIRPRSHGHSASLAVHKVRRRKTGGYSKGSYTAVWHRTNLEHDRPRYLRDSDTAPLIWLQATPTAYRVEPILEGTAAANFLDAALQTDRLFLESTANPPLRRGDAIEAGYEWLQLPGSRHWQLVAKELPPQVTFLNTGPPALRLSRTPC